MKPLNRVRELRKERDMTLKEMGERLGVGEMAVSNYETGRRQPSLETVKRIADIFGVTVDYLLERTDRPEAAPEADPEMAFGASLADGMSYEDLNPKGKAELYEYYQYLKQKYPRDK